MVSPGFSMQTSAVVYRRTLRHVPQIHVDGVDVVALPLYESLNGKDAAGNWMPVRTNSSLNPGRNPNPN